MKIMHQGDRGIFYRFTGAMGAVHTSVKVKVYSSLKSDYEYHYHQIIDGNKRISHAAMEVFLMLNGFEIQARVDEQEQVMRASSLWRIKTGRIY
jgi:hypothetical protein